MRLDHIAFRVKDRQETASLLQKAFGYRIQQEFTINFDDGTKAQCIALEPTEKSTAKEFPWTHTISQLGSVIGDGMTDNIEHEYHTPPEIFVSNGEPGSVVDKWVKNRDGVGGIHHLAFQVEDVRAEMLKWRDNFGAEFTSKDILTCPDDELHQIFMKPHPLLGVVIEFIRRGDKGFCQANVKDLMESTKELK